MPQSLAVITGAGGFIGSHLVEAVLSAGYRVRSFVHYNSNNRWGWLESLDCRSELEIVSGDIRDYDSVLSVVKGADIVFHLAALIGIPYSYVSPQAYVRTNIEGTLNILEAARQVSSSRVLVTSTSETYGTAQYVPIDESHPSVGQSPYAATKIGADQLAFSYWRSFGVPVTVVRPFNTYGPRQSARAVIPSIISQISSGQHNVRIGNLKSTRDFTFVEDTVQGILALAQCDGAVGSATNIGTNTEISIGELVQKIAALMGERVTVETDPERVRPAQSEVDRLVCDNRKLCGLTGWVPRFQLVDGLSRTIQWIISNQGHFKPELYAV